MKTTKTDTICALSTPFGTGAIAVIRLSGKKAIQIINKIFKSNKKITTANPNTVVFGNILDGKKILDEVLVSVFKAPHSYTGEDVVEISCHGSQYIIQRVLELLISNGARPAEAGEFSLRAFLNGKRDLSQTEAIADLIASSSELEHKMAISQMKGEYSEKIKNLREQLVHFASLIELELDFSEEDVEFANRNELSKLVNKIKNEVSGLTESFKLGNVIKKGVPVAIIGEPNVGKSTLLNVLINDDKALVSDIPGTTRDAIEDVFVLNGIPFRFIDTAGIRHSEDTVEKMGIERTFEKVNSAAIVLYIVDISETSAKRIQEEINNVFKSSKDKTKKIIIVANKIDKLVEIPKGFKSILKWDTVFISAKRKENINLLTDLLIKSVDNKYVGDQTIVSNARHYEALTKIESSLKKVIKSLNNNISGDLLAMDIRQALHYLGEITGDVTNDEILGTIFSKFCIGK